VSDSITDYQNTKKNLARKEKCFVSGPKNVFSGRPVDGRPPPPFDRLSLMDGLQRLNNDIVNNYYLTKEQKH